MQYTIEDIKNLLLSSSKKRVAETLDISVVVLNQLIKARPELNVKQRLANSKFTLTKAGAVLIQSDVHDAPVFEVEILRQMLINTERSIVAETLGLSTVSLNKLINSMPEHFGNLPKAIKLPFTLVDATGSPVVITVNSATQEDTVEDPQPERPSIINEVSEEAITDTLQNSFAEADEQAEQAEETTEIH